MKNKRKIIDGSIVIVLGLVVLGMLYTHYVKDHKIKTSTKNIEWHNLDIAGIASNKDNSSIIVNLGTYTKDKENGDYIAYIIGHNVEEIDKSIDSDWDYNMLKFEDINLEYPSFLKVNYINMEKDEIKLNSLNDEETLEIKKEANSKNYTVENLENLEIQNKQIINKQTLGNDNFILEYKEGKNIIWSFYKVNKDIEKVTYTYKDTQTNEKIFKEIEKRSIENLNT